MKLSFEKINFRHIDIIFKWLAEPFIQEFWDNTLAHKEDILNFAHGRKKPSNYCGGKYVYWIALCDGHPFAMLMTMFETAEDHIDDIKLNYLSKTGHTYGIDYMIGDKNYFGKGYGAKTLSAFLDFFRRDFDPRADTFLIDPACNNSRAKHVYLKAGFELVADFVMSGDVSGSGKPHHLLVKYFSSMDKKAKIIKKLRPEDFEIWKSVRLEALKNSPESFASSYEEESSGSDSDFKKNLIQSDVFGVFIGYSLVACAGFYSLNSLKTKHRGVIWGLYTQLEYRGQGIASALIQTIIHHARSRVIQLHLTCVTSNLAAVAFYQKQGFSIYGREDRSLKVAETFFDEYLMILDLTKESIGNS